MRQSINEGARGCVIENNGAGKGSLGVIIPIISAPFQFTFSGKRPLSSNIFLPNRLASLIAKVSRHLSIYTPFPPGTVLLYYIAMNRFELPQSEEDYSPFDLTMDYHQWSSREIAPVNSITNLRPVIPIYQVASAVLRKRRQSELEDTEAAMLPPKHSRKGEADSSYIGTEVLSRSMPSFECIPFAENRSYTCGPDNTYEVQLGGQINFNQMTTGDSAQGRSPDRSASLLLSGSGVQSGGLQLSTPTVQQSSSDQCMRQQLISPGVSGNFDTVARDEVTCINPSILERKVDEGNGAVSADRSGRSSIVCGVWDSSYREIPGAQNYLGHWNDFPSPTIPSDLEAGSKHVAASLKLSLDSALSMGRQNASLSADPETASGNSLNCLSNTMHPSETSQSM